MSTEKDTEIEIRQSDIDRLPVAVERIHDLAEDLLPVGDQISLHHPLPNPELNQKLTELMALLHELHPADVAALLESLPLYPEFRRYYRRRDSDGSVITGGLTVSLSLVSSLPS